MCQWAWSSAVCSSDLEVVRDPHPCPDGREAVDRSEPRVAEPSPPLQVRVDDEAGDGDRPERVRQRGKLPDGSEEEPARGRTEQPALRDGQLAARQLTSGGAGIAGVEACVDQPVQ